MAFLSFLPLHPRPAAAPRQNRAPPTRGSPPSSSSRTMPAQRPPPDFPPPLRHYPVPDDSQKRSHAYRAALHPQPAHRAARYASPCPPGRCCAAPESSARNPPAPAMGGLCWIAYSPPPPDPLRRPLMMSEWRPDHSLSRLATASATPSISPALPARRPAPSPAIWE